MAPCTQRDRTNTAAERQRQAWLRSRPPVSARLYELPGLVLHLNPHPPPLASTQLVMHSVHHGACTPPDPITGAAAVWLLVPDANKHHHLVR